METCIHGEWGDELQIPNHADYDLFRILAGVGWGIGWDQIIPISEPKGLPSDVTYTVQEDLSQIVEHSYSYLTLKEFDEYPHWDMEIKGFQILIEKATGKEIDHASYIANRYKNEEELLKIGIEKKDVVYKVKEIFPPEWKTYIELMRAYSQAYCDGDSKAVRIVFGFDY